ncbi:hypothetical protein CLI92_05910 [Vandammella animalimorsus]|uniref:Uncharacterized protein n=1 Tax=Vandammella animalimorsus TaxID=2029117 RepID=A0A2A2T600_9BURK|nr:hypothetical protein [Vandammella animalimorsus]PAX17080.1 hypothetical protein CLI92_05910 [Vandammella animalimorsus]PAX19053.1 hypothetical protein CLI93_09840 [Vandammella animalimorsus]
MDMTEQELSIRMQRLLEQLITLLVREGEPVGICIGALIEAVGRLAVADGRTEPAAALLRECADALQEQGRASGNLQ